MGEEVGTIEENAWVSTLIIDGTGGPTPMYIDMSNNH